MILQRVMFAVLTGLMLGATLPPAQALAAEPEVTVRQESQRTVKEYRLNGRLYAIEIRPRQGAAYVLLDRNGNGNFERVSAGKVPVPDWVK
ncbi:MAG TPA: DUF2782 domain-containing protein [Halomonas sp.]|nr:DUF2782 domain-containing protein [Halomonas sp.]